jgi:hypothetical protein
MNFDPIQYSIEEVSKSVNYISIQTCSFQTCRENFPYFQVSCEFAAVDARPMRTIRSPKHMPHHCEQDRTTFDQFDHSARSDVLQPRSAHVADSSSNDLASFRSSVSKPSVNQP